MSKQATSDRPGTSKDDFYVSSGLRDLPERAITDMMYISTMRHALHPELRAFLKTTLKMYSKMKKEEGGVDFTEDDYEMPEIGDEYQFKDNDQQEATPTADEAPGPAGPSSSVESDDDDDIICLDDVVHPVTAPPPPPPVDPLPVKTESIEEEDDEIAIIDPPPKPVPVAVTIDDESEAEIQADPTVALFIEKDDTVKQQPRNPFACMFATDEDVKHVGNTETMLSPSIKKHETKDEPLVSPSSSATVPFVDGKPAVLMSSSRKRPRSPSPEAERQPSRPIVPAPTLDSTDELAQLQIKLLREQNAMQSMPPIPKLDELSSISEVGRDILLKQVQSKMVANHLNVLLPTPNVQHPSPLIEHHSILNAEAFALPPPQANHQPIADIDMRNILSASPSIVTAFPNPSGNSRIFEICAFCKLGHPSERCTRFPSFAQRESIAKQRRLCFHCLKVSDPVLCTLIGHIRACEKCPGNHHPALCKHNAQVSTERSFF